MAKARRNLREIKKKEWYRNRKTTIGITIDDIL